MRRHALAGALLLLVPMLIAVRPSLEDLQAQIDGLVSDPNAPRFEDCGDGTVADHQTGLNWEKKTGSIGVVVFCESVACPDPHHVNNRYRWSSTGTDPDGKVFTSFLARLNGEFDPEAATGCFAGHCDWRLPKISEFQQILVGPEAAPGQATTCPAEPCMDPDLLSVIGSVPPFDHWTASTFAASPTFAWVADLSPGPAGLVVVGDKDTVDDYARAVRAGSCQ